MYMYGGDFIAIQILLCISKMLPPLFALAGKPGTAVTAAANVKVICESLFSPDIGG